MQQAMLIESEHAITIELKTTSAIFDIAHQMKDAGCIFEGLKSKTSKGLTLNIIYMSGMLHSWVQYIQMCCKDGIEKEHRKLALACAWALCPAFPQTIAQIIVLSNDTKG